MPLDVIQGETRNRAAAQALLDRIREITDDGTIYLGYPVLATADDRVEVDALLVNQSQGLVAFLLRDVPTSEDDWVRLGDEQDRLFATLESNLSRHESLRSGRRLALTPATATVFPERPPNGRPEGIEEGFFDSFEELSNWLAALPSIDHNLEHALQAALQRVSTIKPAKKRSSVERPDSRGGVLKEIERGIANLDKWQKAAAIESPEGPQRIRGLAGSGKTVVIALKAAYWHAQNPDWRIAITFHSRALYQQIEDLVTRFTFEHTNDTPDEEYLKIVHSWGSRGRLGVYSMIASALGQTPRDWAYARSKYGSDAAFQGVCQELLDVARDRQPDPIFDAVLIDEAQDLPPEFFQLARTIDQDLSSPAKVDAWFEAKTKGMTDLSRAELKRRWGTMQKVVSSEPRARQIVDDILFDMETKPRLIAGRGNALLVGSSIYQACKFYELFCQAGFKGKCAIVTSYQPQAGDISKEDSGEGATEKLRQYEIYRQMLADHFNEPADAAMKKIELFETQVKERFIEAPGQMRLLIVVDKLLTGFDAPSAIYLYIDKKMQDHGLFQAICRVNRLDGEDKDYGYIVDYRDLFNSLESAITDYTSGALDGYDKKDIDGLLSNRIDKAREDLDEALERIRALCEPVEPPKNTLQYQKYFCAAEHGNAEQIKENEPKRVELYKAVSALARCYGNLANEMEAAGYTESEASVIKDEVAHYVNVRDEVKLGAGEDVDFKQYEAGMRHLLDTYISAKPSEVISNFQDAGLIELIVNLGAGAIDKLPDGIKKDPEAVAETITNNIRKVIIDERPLNPKYYDRMSELLDAILEERRRGALEYKDYLAKLLDHAAKLGKGESETAYPEWADNGARRALVDFFDANTDLAKQVDDTILNTKPDSWVGNAMKERMVKRALKSNLPDDFDQLDDLFELVKARNEYR